MSRIFVGEKRSNTAIRMGVTWLDGRLAAKTLHEALRSAGIDPNACRFTNIYLDGDGWEVSDDTVAELERLESAGWTIVALGRKVQRELSRLGIGYVGIVHPAARGSIRKTERYHAHVAAALSGASA